MNQLVQEGEKYIMHTYGRFPIVLDHGEGVYLYDTTGKKYLDMYAGIAVNLFGYGYAPLTDALKAQIDKMLHVSNYYYTENLINASKLLVIDRKTGEMRDRIFSDIVEYFHEGDVLILNDSKVFPARIYGTKEETGANIEFLLHKHFEGNTWQVMAKPGKRLKIGTKVDFGEGLVATVLEKQEDGLIMVDFDFPGNDIFKILDKIGNMPLPPYIKEKLSDPDRYQTVYAHNVGSAAAPTAGFHFTTDLLDKLRSMGVTVAFVTLHVGLGTFLPVEADDIKDHIMHSEVYSISEETADIINTAKKEGRRVICCGTTSVRTVESSASIHDGHVEAETRSTEIFIYPGFKFNVVDSLITNFHLPKSTLVMLVSAFYDLEGVRKAYAHAVENRYRFFSFGDACLFI